MAKSTRPNYLLWGSLLLSGGLLLLFLFRFGFILYILGLLLWTMPKDNDAPANQLTLVQGTVTSAETGRPLPGVLLRILASVPHTDDYRPTQDSMRTDAQGRYRLHFRNKPTLYYRVSFDHLRQDTSGVPSRYVFAEADYQSLTDPGSQDHLSATDRNLTLGCTNTVNFRPGERHLVAVRARNRHTGYRFMELPSGYHERISPRDTTLYLTLDELPAGGVTIRYLDHRDKQAGVGDTAVPLVLQNPGARFPDTLRATLTPPR